MVALAGCMSDSPEVRVYSGRDEPVTTTVRIATDMSEEPPVDETVTVKPPSSDDYAVRYSVQTGKAYQVTITTDDGVTGDYRWDLPPNAGHRRLAIEIGQSDIEFTIDTVD